jgi:hypothetical protein
MRPREQEVGHAARLVGVAVLTEPQPVVISYLPHSLGFHQLFARVANWNTTHRSSAIIPTRWATARSSRPWCVHGGRT